MWKYSKNSKGKAPVMKKVSGDDISKAFKKYCEKEVPGIGAADEKKQQHFGAA